MFLPPRQLEMTLTSRQGQEGQEGTDGAADVPAETAEGDAAGTEGAKKEGKPRVARPQKQRGPPEDGIPSKTKVMVANLPYDLTEDKVRYLSDSKRFIY
jgi:hypothetical protein